MPSKLPPALIIVALLVLALDVFIAFLPRILRKRGVYLWWRTMFGPAMVLDSTDNDGTTVRLLNVRSKYQSVCYVDTELRWELACVYHKYFAQIVDIAKLAGPEGRLARAVVIGGGGYSFPKWLVSHCPNLHTTVVEIDPKITEIAREHFFVDELIKEFDTEQSGQLELVCADGWPWLQHSSTPYDLIVNDAFSGKRPLGPLGTREGAHLVHEHLTAQGIYLANVIAPLEGRGSEHVQNVVEAFRAEFAYVWLIPEDDEHPELTGDNVLIASDTAYPIAHRYAR